MSVDVLVIGAVVGFGLFAVVLFGVALYRAFTRPVTDDDRRFSRVDLELDDAERCRRDVRVRAERERTVAALDAMGDDLADVIPLPEREPAEIVPFPTIRRGGGFQR